MTTYVGRKNLIGRRPGDEKKGEEVSQAWWKMAF